MDINAEILSRKEELEEIIYGYLPKEKGYEKIIYEAMAYSIKAGGKRIRPMLMNETYKLFGGDSKEIEPFLVAIEMIHTYSLVHDDLPAMDNDSLRRGMPTTHKKYGEANGILCGDALLNYAFETAALSFDYAKEDLHMMNRVAKANKLLSYYAGVSGMIGGQVVDVANETNPDISLELLDYINEKKTSALLQASMGVGAVLAGASEKDLSIVLEVARLVGLAFQIQDDVLDVTASQEVLGKDIGSDEKNGKTTYVSLLGIDGAKAKVKEYTDLALNLLANLNYKNEFLNQLLIYMINREK